MMITISANEVKRRGVIALQEQLLHGPVHIVKNNRPTCVVISEEEYRRLRLQVERRKGTPKKGIAYLLAKPATGQRTPKQIDRLLAEKRKGWEDG